MAKGELSSDLELYKAQLVVARADKEKKASKAGSKKKSKENVNPQGDGDAKSRRKLPAIVWSKEENWDLSFRLIAIIEDSATFMVAFGFDKGNVSNPSSGGKKLSEQHRSIAHKLFIEQPDSRWSWKADDVDQLKDVVRNRINALKRDYSVYHKEMSETGQGLLDNGQEDQITPGSEIDNIWKKIQSKFPWYKQMHALMGTSPVIDRSAIAHSATPLDTSILARNGVKPRSESPRWDIEDVKELDSEIPSSPVSHDSSPSITSPSSPARGTTPTTPAKPTISVSNAASMGKKRKAMNEVVADVSLAHRENAYKMQNFD